MTNGPKSDNVVFAMSPSDIHPHLQWDRLKTIAQLLVEVRQNTVELFDPSAGDGAWSLGCRVYERSCNGLRALADEFPWFDVLSKPESLAFLFNVGDVPCRFYRGDSELPGSRMSRRRADELGQLQMAFPWPHQHINFLWRFVVETDEDSAALRVALTQVNMAGETERDWTVWERGEAGGLAPVVDLPPPVVDLPPPTVGIVDPASDDEAAEADADDE